MQKVLEVAQKYVLYAVLALFAVFVIFSNSSPFIVSKEIVLVAGASLLILLWVAKMILKGSITLYLGKFDLGVILIAIAYLAATFFATPNKMEAYLVPGTTTFVLGGAVLYFLINQFDHKTKTGAKAALLTSGLLLSAGSLFSSFNLLSKIPQLPAAVQSPAFNLIGGPIPSITFLAGILLLSASLLVKEKNAAKKTFYGIACAVILFGISVLVASTLPGRTTSPRFLPVGNSWEVAVETLKKSPLVGVGPSNYLTAFNLFRPVSYNSTDLWQVRFATASNFYLTLVTETGLLGLFAVVVLIAAIYKYTKRDFKLTSSSEDIAENLEKSSVVVLAILFALLPVAPVVLVAFFAVLAIVSGSEHKNIQMNIAAGQSNDTISSRIPAIIVGVPFVVGVAAVLFFGAKILKAEATYTKALDALSQNDAKTTYDLMAASINQNPKVDRYHAGFAQVNMALATSIASKQKVEEADRNNITQLVQQAINEGKATVSLNPQRSANWEVLAQIYRSVMPFAQGADQFALQTYSQAIALDPFNPNLRISLGGVYYALGNYPNAVEAFKLAVAAKPDLANAHYNLAVAYREMKDYDNAIIEMNNVLKLVKSGSQDATLAKQTLDDLQSKKSAAKPATTSTENLTPPTKDEPTNVKPPINLPQEATPPATQQ